MRQPTGSPRHAPAAGGSESFAGGVLVGNEFASVEVSVDTAGRVPRLILRDVMSGRARHIDPLVLEALIHMTEETMRALADPNLIVSD